MTEVACTTRWSQSFRLQQENVPDYKVRVGAKTYARDPFGSKVSETSGASTTDYLFDGAEVVQEKTGTATTYYTRGLGDRLINRRAGTGMLRYYHHDSIGSVVGLTDSAGDLTDTYSYTAFGSLKNRTGTDAQPYRYLGNAYRSQAGLYDFHARMYDLGAGRFTSTDPVSGLATMPQTQNPYAYGINGPLAYPDPNGTCIVPVVGQLACAEVALLGAMALTGASASACAANPACPEAMAEGLEDMAEATSRLHERIGAAVDSLSDTYLERGNSPVINQSTFDKANGKDSSIKIPDKQFGKKIGQHAEDFGLDPSNPAHRAQLRKKIEDIASSPDKVAEGTFRSLPRKFLVKGEDVVVTTPSGDFVTILKGGINNPSVRRALGE